MGPDRIHPQLGSALRPTRCLLPATDELRNQSAARNVVPDDAKATIWRESRARVRMGASTLSDSESAGIHTYLWENRGRPQADYLRAAPSVDVDRQAGRN